MVQELSNETGELLENNVSEVENNVSEVENNASEVENLLKGGKKRRRRLTKKRTRSTKKKVVKKKTTRKKGPSKWIMHVKAFCKKTGKTFPKALKDPLCKKSFKH